MLPNIICYFCFLIFNLAIISFFKWCIERPKINNIWLILCLVLSFVPILNMFGPLVFLIFAVLYHKMINGEYFLLKDNKINRFLFNNMFSDKK